MIPVPHIPVNGETVLGADYSMILGGKGANQAIAAARLGAKVSFTGRIGNDKAGRQIQTSLTEAGINISNLIVDPTAPTGLALITVDQIGDNAIVVSPGSNARLQPEDLDTSHLADASITLLQLEVSLPTVLAAAEAATGTVILNPAPAQPLPQELLANVDVIVPNRFELEALTGCSDNLVANAKSLGVPTVIVTLGSEGALLVSPEEVITVDAPTVKVIDTTACGDAFCGALAACIASGMETVDATRRAVMAGSLTATRYGAQPSLPTLSELETAENKI